MRRKPKSRKMGRPKARLGLPDLDQSKAAVIGSLRSPESQRGYRHAIDEFIEWYCSEPRLSLNRTVVLRYRIQLESRNLAPGTINVRLAAVRRLAYEAADPGLLSPELAAGIRRVKSAKKLGVRLGNWLSAKEARALWQSPNAETLKGKRDRAIIAVLLAAVFGDGNWRISVSTIFSAVKTVGQSWISSERVAMFELSPYPIG
jgi:integrase